MWGEVARILKIRNQEDFFGKQAVMMLIITLFFGFLSIQGHRERIFAHLILLCIISLNASQILSLFKRKECDFIMIVNSRSENNKFITLCLTAFTENLYYLVIMIIQLLCLFKFSFGMSVLISGVHFMFALSLGIFTSQVYFMNLGMITLITYYLVSFFMATSWAFDENWRFLSLTLQLNNTKIINQSNNMSLLVLVIIMGMIGRLLFSKYKTKWKTITAVILAWVALMGVFVSMELRFNSSRSDMGYQMIQDKSTDSIKVYYNAIDVSQIETMVTATTELIHSMERYSSNDSNIECIYFDKYYISIVPNLYKTRPIPFEIKDKNLKINVFSDAIINYEEPELFSEMLNRVYDQLEFNTPNYENKYIHQMISGNREFVLLQAYEKISKKDKKVLVSEAERIISKRKNDEPTDYNYVKKIMVIMQEQYPEKIPELFNAVQKELPESNEAFRKLFETNFPELTNNQEIMKLISTI